MGIKKSPAKTAGDEFTETNTVVFVEYLILETDLRLTHGFDFFSTDTTVTTSLRGKPAAYITLPKLAFSLPAGGSRPAIRQPWATGPRGNSV